MGKIKERRAVLIARFSQLGDVAMALPSVYDACYANPGVSFYFLTHHHAAGIFVNRPANLTVSSVNFDNYRGITGLWRLVRALIGRYEVTDFIDLQDEGESRKMRFYMRMCGVKVGCINKGTRALDELTRRVNKVLVQLKPMSERYRDVFYKSGIALANDFDTIWGAGQRGDERLFAELSRPKREGETWIAIAPFARYRGKMYPIEQMERVIEHFAGKDGHRVFLFGYGKSEEEIAERIAHRYPGVANVSGERLSLEAQLSLLSHCDRMLTMDSANMHLASLVGLPTVSVWGATHPYAGYMGWGQRTRDVVQLDMTCRPCSPVGDRPCERGDYHCLAGITPKMIIERVENL